MAKKLATIDVRSAKKACEAHLEEWLGFDIPSEGEDDYLAWMSAREEIDAIVTVQDAIDFLESRGVDANEVLKTYTDC